MNIIVCVKQVLDTAAKIKVKEGRVDAESIPKILNPYDEFAVEEALRIKEKIPDTEVTIISLGPESFRDVLRTALAMGADKAVHLLDPAFQGLDNLGVARSLALAIRSLSFDLILCGRQAVDDDMAQVGPALAVLIDLPFVSVITKLEFSSDGKNVEVTRQVEGGSEIINTSLPVLLTCQKGLNEPRLPSLKGIMAAKKKEIKILNASAIGFDPSNMGVSANRVKEIEISLPPPRKKGIILQGSSFETTSQLVKILREEIKVV